MRRIAALFRPYWRRLTGLLGVVVMQAGAGVASPFLLRLILDRALPEQDFALLSLLAGGILAATAASSALGVLSTWLANTIGQRVMHDVRVAVYSHLLRLSLAFFTRTRAGELQSRLANDVGGVDNVITNTAAGAVQSGTTTLAIVAALLLLDWRLALLTLAVVPVCLLATLGLGRQLRTLAGGRQRRLANLTELVAESMSVAGVLLAKTLGRQAELLRRFAAESWAIAQLEVQATMAGQWRVAARRGSLTVIPALVYWLAGLAMARGLAPVSLGTVVAFTSMLNRLVAPVGAMQSLGVGFSTSLALFSRIFEVLDLPVEIADRPGARPLALAEGRVSLEGVWFRYGPDEPWLLRGIDLDCPPGTTTAIVGESGAGKTTLAYLIARLYEPERGRVCLDGADVREVTLASLADAVGLVAQDTYLFHASIRENLRFARPEATDAEIEQSARAARIHDLIAALPAGYDTVVGERGYRFSGGERQRLAIARLLLRHPPILILDEATSALDTETERAVQAAFDTAARGRTTIAIAHRLSTVRHADQIVVLDGGQIVERGTHAELMALDGRYAALLKRPATADAPAASA